MIYKLQKEGIMKRFDNDKMTKSSLTFNLLTLPKHAVDIANNSIIYTSDVACLTRTQIVPDQDICHVFNFIKDFIVIRNDSFYKFQSTAFCHRNEVGLIYFQGFQGVRKESFSS